MDQQKNQQTQLKNNPIDFVSSIITNKRSRSLLFLVVTALFIIASNGLLPLLSGQARYTVSPVEITYAQYEQLQGETHLYSMTYGATIRITTYQTLYIMQHPGMSPEEMMNIVPPPDFKVSVYTQFFYQAPWWYIDTGISLASAVFLFYALFNYLVTRDKDERVEHVNGELKIKELNDNYLDPDTFEPWIDKFNRNRKVKQHTRNVKYQLKKLEKDTPFEIKRRFKKHFIDLQDVDVNNLLPVPYVEMSKAERKYIDKKEELLSMLDEEYIKEVVVETDVPNFKEIRAGFVYSGINIEGVAQDEYSTIKSDAEKIRGSLASKILISLAMTVAFASVFTVLAINVNEQDPFWIVVTVIMKIIPLLLQIYFAMDYTNEFMEKHLLPNLKARENIAMRYLADMDKEGKLGKRVQITQVQLQEKGKK